MAGLLMLLLIFSEGCLSITPNNRFNEAVEIPMPEEPMEMEAPRNYAVNEMVGEVEEVRYEVRFEEMPTKSFQAPGQDAEIDVRSYGESMGERIG